MQGDLLQQGLTLMLVGMGTVFVFLTTLVIAMTLMSGLTKRFQPPPSTPDDVPADEVAAITAAINRHRQR
ncbi:MAG: OadG family transporter subunit [Pseudomonadota bacterium]